MSRIPCNWTHARTIYQRTPIPSTNLAITENQLLCLHLISHLPCSFLGPKVPPSTLLSLLVNPRAWAPSNVRCIEDLPETLPLVPLPHKWWIPFDLPTYLLSIFFIDSRSALTYIPNYLHLLCAIYLRPATHPLCHYNTKGNPSYDGLHHRFNTTLVPCHCFF